MWPGLLGCHNLTQTSQDLTEIKNTQKMSLSEFRYYLNKKEAGLKTASGLDSYSEREVWRVVGGGDLLLFPQLVRKGFSVATEDRVRGNGFRLKG